MADIRASKSLGSKHPACASPSIVVNRELVYPAGTDCIMRSQDVKSGDWTGAGSQSACGTYFENET